MLADSVVETPPMPQDKASAMMAEEAAAAPLPDEESSEAPVLVVDNVEEATAMPATGPVVENGVAPPTTSSSSITGSSAVTTERKNRLLLEARADRLAWIQKVPLPYVSSESSNDGSIWKNDERLAMVGSSRVAVEAPAVTRVLDILYGIQEDQANTAQVAERIHGLLQPLGTSQQDLTRAIPSGQEVLQAEVAKHGADSKTGAVVMAYQNFMSKLCLPECAMLVQGMRNFCRHVCNQTDEKKMATALEHYLNATLRTIQSHAAWQKQPEDTQNIRRSLESFIYGHVSLHISQILLADEETKAADEEWTERLTSLRFVNPHHLELDCFMVEEEESSTEMPHVEEMLKDPIEALLSVDGYYSPYEKLQRILNVYHGVNAALSQALNRRQLESDLKNKVLPSADHVLPTLILVVLRAQPKRMIVDLALVEKFCPSSYLRGEAGYAFTNLYGAVQFMRDINLDEGPDSLDISAEEFREGLQKCRAAAEERLSNQKTSLLPAPLEDTTGTQELPQDIAVTEIRAARLRGEDMNLEWALQYHDDQRDVNKSHMTDESSIPLVQQAAAMSKSYSFLTTRAEDVKVADLPLLLKEYRQLVHTTEVLLAERTARLAAERKKQLAKKRKKLQANAAAVDPNLM